MIETVPSVEPSATIIIAKSGKDVYKRQQELLATHIGKHTWSEGLEYTEELALLPEPVRLSDVESETDS